MSSLKKHQEGPVCQVNHLDDQATVTFVRKILYLPEKISQLAFLGPMYYPSVFSFLICQAKTVGSTAVFRSSLCATF